jgi:DNA-binding XRE family transcriptional regulator
MPSPTYCFRRARGLCIRCGRKGSLRRRLICDDCRACIATWRGSQRARALGARIRAARLALGYRQSEFGVLLGISRDQISGLEQGTWPSLPSLPLQQRLADLLGCPVVELGITAREPDHATP